MELDFKNWVAFGVVMYLNGHGYRAYLTPQGYLNVSENVTPEIIAEARDEVGKCIHRLDNNLYLKPEYLKVVGKVDEDGTFHPFDKRGDVDA